MSGLQLDDATRRVLQEAQVKAALDAKTASGNHRLGVLLPVGCDALMSEGEVLQNIALALGATMADMAKELAKERGFDVPASSIFGADEKVYAKAAADDWHALHVTVAASDGEHAYDDQPQNWREAAHRMHAVVEAARRAKAAHDAASMAPGSAGRTTDDNKAGWFKPLLSAGKNDQNFAAGGDLLTPITATAFARGESIATRGDSALTEVRRLVTMPGTVGAAARA